jgi:pyrroline-5-carboxylate reductase
MGEAILKGILESSFLNAGQVAFYEKSASRRDYIEKTYGIVSAEDICSSVKDSKYLLMAVKPQNIKYVINDINDCFIKGSNSIISIAAGIDTEFYEKNLGAGTSVIRIMPNTPAIYKKGISTISRGKYASLEDQDFAISLMEKIGDCILIEEKLQDISTAINGSGPAYFFLFCRALIETAAANGLDMQIAKKLVIGTMMGSGIIMERSGLEIDELISKVASPGGTTEKALETFEDAGLEDIVKNAVESALKRSKELGKQISE